MRKIVLTGGPYSGKSTLAAELCDRHANVALAPEAAIRVIEALNRELGSDRARRFRAEHPDRFQLRIAELQLELEGAASRSGADLIVCDRGLIDGVAYCRHWGVDPPAGLTEALKGASYQRVFLLDTLTSVEPRTDTGRIDDHESLRIRDRIYEVYVEFGHDPVQVPSGPLEARLAQLLEILGI